MAAAADGGGGAVDAAVALSMPPQPLTFLEEIQALETVHDNALSVSTRLNNRVTVTGFKRISTTDLDAICMRHGRVYVAEISPEGARPEIQLKFRDAPEMEEAPTSMIQHAIDQIDAETVDTAIRNICDTFECLCNSRRKVRSTWILTFDTRMIKMQSCVALRQHSSQAFIEVVLQAGVGMVVTFSERSDTRTNLRYLRKHASQHFVPRTALVGWHLRPNMYTAARKRKVGKASAPRDTRRKSEGIMAAAYRILIGPA